MKNPIILLLLFTLFAASANAQPAEQVVIDSVDWVDVYSAIMYANFKGIPYHFAISEPHARVIAQYMDKTKDIHLIESESLPFLANYKSTLESSGFKVAEETRSSGGKTLNLKLAGELDLKKFIVVDDNYGYNAISAASYAVKSKSWVLFTDRININEVYGFLKAREVEKVIVYGHVDKAVKEKLGEFAPEIIDEGNRFDDNLAIVRKYMAISPSEQVVLTNGDFIEASIMSGESPVVFIGAQTVPNQVIDYVKARNIKGSILIGNDLTNSARILKDATGISVFIKFGQGRQVNRDFSLVEELDRFYLPRYELSLDAVSAQYNEATKQLEIVYRNKAKIGEFFKSSVGVLVDGKRIATVGDEAAQYIEAESDSGQAYTLDLTEHVRSSNIAAQVSAEFGEAPKTLNLVLTKALDVGMVSVQDTSEIEVSDMRYDTNTQRVELTIVNTGNVPSYATPEVTLLIEGDEEKLRLGNYIQIEAGKKSTASLRVELTGADLADNPQARVHVAYGERPALLIKSLDKTLHLQVVSGVSTEIVAAILLSGVLLAAVILYRRKSAKAVHCSKCGESIPVGAKFCLRCGSEVR